MKIKRNIAIILFALSLNCVVTYFGNVTTKSDVLYHTPFPGPTRLADPNRVRGARPYTGTLYLMIFFLFFLKPNLYLWVWPTSYNIIKILYTFTKSHLQLLNCTFTFTNQSTEPTCSEPLQVCWPSCMRMFTDVFSCTYTD